MNIHPEILAKSEKNGAMSLYDHLRFVGMATEKTAASLGLDPFIAKSGAYLHDIGKTHPDFQKKLWDHSPSVKMSLRHEISSILFLPVFPHEQWDKLIDMVIAHHRSPQRDSRSQGILDLVDYEGEEEVFNRHSEGWDDWSPLAVDILNSLGVSAAPVSYMDAQNAFSYTIEYCSAKKQGWSVLKGILIGSDYLASAIAEKTVFVKDKLFQIPDLSYFRSPGRESELYPLSLLDTNDPRPHTIVSAPTGAGKTDFLMRRCKSRIFYTLPFQASINAMFRRFKDAFPPDTDLRVLHASSKLLVKNNDDYEEKVLQEMIGSSVKVLTPFQISSLITGTKGFEAVAIDVSGTDVILDEIHSYSEIAQALVIEIIRVLLNLNCRIHVGTATMPRSLFDKIIELLGGLENTYVVNLSDEILDTFNRHRVHKHNDEASAFSVIPEAIGKKQKILIVSNRVQNAQRRFVQLTSQYPDIPALLIHSRFRRKDRAALEDLLKSKFNSSLEMPDGCIVVSTQVVEVSLDISFDIMITDASPLDSLIQRFGRINRYRTKESVRNNIIKEVHVIAPPSDKRSSLPYSKEILERSFSLLPDGEILLERSLQDKINEVYPSLDLRSISTSSVWNNSKIRLKELCHNPKSVLMQMLDIDSASCIRFSDRVAYESGSAEDRISLEIPVPRSALFRTFTNHGRSDYGTNPLIVPDELYQDNLGLTFLESDNFI
ncbi:MAG: CRISPR-associated helicase Cas3' [Ignavibacteriales bacterium]|nr:CRISPR-associated helicase Cas3' [Ignavibacteriales bacterium]